MIIEAKNLKVGDRYKSNTTSTIQEVIEIVNISDKAITYRTNRVFPDFYASNFPQRKRLNTKLEVVN